MNHKKSKAPPLANVFVSSYAPIKVKGFVTTPEHPIDKPVIVDEPNFNPEPDPFDDDYEDDEEESPPDTAPGRTPFIRLPTDVPKSFDTIEEAREYLRQRTKSSRAHRAWFMALQMHTGIDVWHRDQQPCWGELREYLPGEYRPPDLFWPFPPGKPLMLGAVGGHMDTSNSMATAEWSPFRSLFSRMEILGPGKLFFSDLDLHPDVLVSFFFALSNGKDAVLQRLSEFLEREPDIALQVLATKVNYFGDGPAPHLGFHWAFSHPKWLQSGVPNMKLLAAGDPGTKKVFSNRDFYDRQNIEALWTRTREKDEVGWFERLKVNAAERLTREHLETLYGFIKEEEK